MINVYACALVYSFSYHSVYLDISCEGHTSSLGICKSKEWRKTGKEVILSIDFLLMAILCPKMDQNTFFIYIISTFKIACLMSLSGLL